MNHVQLKTRVVGVDVSSERTVLGIVDIRGNVIAKDSFPTFDCENVADFETRLCDSIEAMIEANGGYETIRSVGVSSPSANFVTGCIENAANLPWKGVIPLAAMMQDRLGLAVGVANDAHATAMGEKVYGSAHGMNDFVVLNLGVGLGSCIFSGGRPQLGAHGFAGEVGHTCVVLNGRQCGCGHKGCLETYVNAKGIVDTATEVMAESDAPSLMRSLENLSARTIKECCDQGDELAIEVYRRTGHMLGLGLANFASIVNPEAMIFTGGISQAGDWLLEPTAEVFEEHIFPNMKDKVKLLVSVLDNRERNVLGASAVAWDVKEYSLFK